MLAAFPLSSPSERSPSPAPGRAPPTAPPDPPRFADLLQRGQATHGVLARPAEVAPAPVTTTAPPETAARDADDTTPSQAQDATRNAAAKAGTKAAAPRAREKAPPAATPTPHAPDAAPADAAARTATDPPAADEGDASAAAPGAAPLPAAELRDWLAALKLSPHGAAASAGADGADAATGTALPTTPADAPGARGAADDARHRRGEAAADDKTRAAAIDGAQQPLAAAPTAELAAASERRAEGTPANAVHTALPSPVAGAAGAVPRGFDIVAPAPIALPTPLHAPDFAQALGAQVSVLAKDGVQQAELHLNPADMGPISVQIEIDGAQARVDFQAHAAQTREVIERGLPELASALREQGLTLSGGGVSQQAPGRGGSDGREPARPGRVTAHGIAGATEPRTIALPVPQGRLDLYA